MAVAAGVGELRRLRCSHNRGNSRIDCFHAGALRRGARGLRLSLVEASGAAIDPRFCGGRQRLGGCAASRCTSSFNLLPGSNQQATTIGKGRVFQTAIAPGFEDPENLGLVVQGVKWAVKAIPSLEAKPSKQVKTWIVTGGHSHDPSFYELFENDSDIAPIVEPHPNSYRSKGSLNASDVLVLYDSVQEIPDDQRKNLVDFVSSGKGLVVVHHALVDWCNWEWWYRDVVGARWLQTSDPLPKWKSTWKHDVPMTVRPVGEHPVTKGVGVLQIQDETYKGLWFSPDIQVLMRTDDPTSDGPVVWISPFKKSRVVVIQLGHDYKAHRDPGYRRLIHNAVMWASGRGN